MKIRDLSEAIKIEGDKMLYGIAFVDAAGRRVDPTRVVIAPDGTSALDTGGTVYKPQPLNLASEDRQARLLDEKENGP